MPGLTLEDMPPYGPVYGPPDGDNLPGIVILHGSEGPGAGWSHRFAAILAVHGYLTLPLSYGEGDVWGAGPIRDVDLSVVPEAGAALGAHVRCSGRVGLFGWSRGGEAALIVATLGSGFDAIAAHAPADRVGAAFDPADPRPDRARPRASPDDQRAWMWPAAEAALAPGTPIPVESYAGPLFLSVGDADEIWDPQMTLDLAARRSTDADTDLFVAAGQGHGFTFDAEPQLWARLLTFFERTLA